MSQGNGGANQERKHETKSSNESSTNLIKRLIKKNPQGSFVQTRRVISAKLGNVNDLADIVMQYSNFMVYYLIENYNLDKYLNSDSNQLPSCLNSDSRRIRIIQQLATPFLPTSPAVRQQQRESAFVMSQEELRVGENEENSAFRRRWQRLVLKLYRSWFSAHESFVIRSHQQPWYELLTASPPSNEPPAPPLNVSSEPQLTELPEQKAPQWVSSNIDGMIFESPAILALLITVPALVIHLLDHSHNNPRAEPLLLFLKMISAVAIGYLIYRQYLRCSAWTELEGLQALREHIVEYEKQSAAIGKNDLESGKLEEKKAASSLSSSVRSLSPVVEEESPGTREEGEKARSEKSVLNLPFSNSRVHLHSPQLRHRRGGASQSPPEQSSGAADESMPLINKSA